MICVFCGNEMPEGSGNNGYWYCLCGGPNNEYDQVYCIQYDPETFTWNYNFKSNPDYRIEVGNPFGVKITTIIHNDKILQELNDEYFDITFKKLYSILNMKAFW